MNLSANLPSTVKLCLLIFVTIFITSCGFPQDDKKEDSKSNTPPISTNNTTVADLLNNTTVLALLNNTTIVGLLNNTTIVNLLNNTDVVATLNDIIATNSLKQVHVVLGYRLYGDSTASLPKFTACDNSSSVVFKSIDNAGSLVYFVKDKSSEELYTGAVLPANYSIKVSCNGIDFESSIPKITNNATVTVTLLIDAKTYQIDNNGGIEVYTYQSST